jgi:CelD/BcsL family acetyltransferase involved in cellulose biosynthesis
MIATGKEFAAENTDQKALPISAISEARSAPNVFQIDPIHDSRWPLFLRSHPNASVFHTPGWLQALQRAYDYQPVAFTTSAAGQPLENGVAFCRVNSWLTGSRLVSLPFSDHCQPLAKWSEAAAAICRELERELAREKYRYIELRPFVFKGVGTADADAFVPSEQYYFHKLDLQPGLDALFRSFHKNCIQRKIWRAEQERLTYEAGRSKSILAKFYHLQLLTRRRHQVPPQPIGWFRNLVDCLAEKLTIRVLSKDDRPIASILTLSFKSTLVYKYGCSDASFHRLGGMPLLFWKAIQEGKQQGAQEFDLGRSDVDNPGLTVFKDHLGASRSRLVYFRLVSRLSGGRSTLPRLQTARRMFARIPYSVAEKAGTLLYRHMG